MEAARGGLHLGDDTRGVVCAELAVSDTAGPGSGGVCGGLEGYGFEAGGVVGTDGGGDGVEESGAWGTDSESALSTDHGWSDVERVATSAVQNVLSDTDFGEVYGVLTMG